MVADGVYINDVQNTKFSSWEYKISIGRIGNYARVVFANPGGITNADVTYFDDLKIYYNSGTLVFRGRVHDIVPNQGGTLTVSAFGYVKDIIDRFANETYTGKSSSFIVNALVTGYSNITGTNITTTTDNIGGGAAYLVKATSVFDEVLKLADAINFDFWVDNDNDFHFQERNYTSSGVAFDYTGGSNVINVTVPKQGSQIFNRVEVRGGPAGSDIVALVEDKASQDFYGVKKEWPTIFDNSAITVADCTTIGQGIMDKYAWADPVITIDTFGQETIIPGDTVVLSNFFTDYEINDGTYLLLEKTSSLLRGYTRLKLAQYNSNTEDMLADIIRRMRKRERVDLDQTDTITKILRYYEYFAYQGYTLKMVSQTIGASCIAGHQTNGVAGNTTDNIVAGLSGRTLTTEISKTVGIGGVES